MVVWERYMKLMFPLESLVEGGLRKMETPLPRVYKTKTVARWRAANKVAYKSRRTNQLVKNHSSKR